MDKKNKKVLAFDFGGSSGRAMLGTFNGNSIEIKEVHRFSNDPVNVCNTLYWDILRLFFEIKNSLIKAKQFGEIDSIGIDTWGVDFGLIDENGMLLENPVHYRDTRTIGMLEESFKKINKNEFYSITGNQFMEINTAFQLLSLKEKRSDLLERADKMLLMSDLFNYLLTGKKVSENSIASTTQLFDAKNRIWAEKVIDSLGIPKRIFTKIIPSGTVIGRISDDISKELEIYKSNVIAVAGHDTQSALVSVPAEEENFIFLSCGTWSLLGTEIEEPIINDKSSYFNITNESAYGNKVSFLKNIIGLWLIQESKRQWEREGEEYTFPELEYMAKESTPFKCFIDPDDPVFVQAGNIPQRIRDYCLKTKQDIPETIGEIVRCINESLAMKYRYSFEEIQECTNQKYKKIYMVGGGTQSKLLCQMTSNSCNVKISAGPIEATVLGNIAIQLMALGEIDSLSEARAIIKDSQDIFYYTPENHELWNKEYKKFKEIIFSKGGERC
ncbi:rhamnulokinase [Clostridium butyricum]|uniref:Rhamnulokinase (Rhamnulose kinase) n=1 Tax=Clostridium butyricum E4 str. BoNT E BL5262 TaxID=632245 RepID=C4ILU3_CLOBU|nr:rhamnulokinase family protein [Clostridium butyricum]EDT74687.1 rhamnulokinase [Clostridium butyricum 5521]EEP52692.1 rhamnulokinase (Rhamnulose kinase) [Clostridium butyricum E4 str. BoNT E BL5262]NFL29913.1 rhamnulokinase [Clostridium butyricum]NFS17480.1 rhamnulokinase [Clostridium butyricum]